MRKDYYPTLFREPKSRFHYLCFGVPFVTPTRQSCLPLSSCVKSLTSGLFVNNNCKLTKIAYSSPATYVFLNISNWGQKHFKLPNHDRKKFYPLSPIDWPNSRKLKFNWKCITALTFADCSKDLHYQNNLILLSKQARSWSRYGGRWIYR